MLPFLNTVETGLAIVLLPLMLQRLTARIRMGRFQSSGNMKTVVIAPPVGSIKRGRKVIDDILWFTKTERPYTDLTACGNFTNRKGPVGSTKHFYGQSDGYVSGTARISDVFEVLPKVDRNVDHDAIMPPKLAEQLIKTFARPGTVVLDPFMGSGTTALVARQLGYDFVGFEITQKHVDTANGRLLKPYHGV